MYKSPVLIFFNISKKECNTELWKILKMQKKKREKIFLLPTKTTRLGKMTQHFGKKPPKPKILSVCPI